MVSSAELVATPNGVVPRATHVSQVTAVEQARAVAEVLAAVQVAQQCPRDQLRAWADVEAACARLALAERAFYSVPNRGSGPSVHLARELARIWGNIDYGVRELRRDDAAGESEIQAFAWDQQTNARTTRSFIVPHQRMVTDKKTGKQERKALFDLGDIYLNNQNIGARAVRECIYAILPGDLVAEAEDRCKATIKKGDGKPLPERIANMITNFKATHGVTEAQIAARLGRPSGQWTAQDLASLTVVYRSIERSETIVAEEFPAAAATAADLLAPATQDVPGAPPAAQSAPDGGKGGGATITGSGPAPIPDDEPEPQGITGPQRAKLNALYREAGIDDRTSRLAWASDVVGREVASSNELTRIEAAAVIGAVEKFIASQQPPADGDQP